MALLIRTTKKWLAVKISLEEISKAFPGSLFLCDHTNNPILGESYYIPVLNHILCKEAYEEWLSTTKYYASNVPYETKNLKYLKTKIKVF